MLGACFHAKYLWSLIILLIIPTFHHERLLTFADRDIGMQASDGPQHLNFFRSSLRGRQRVVSCGKDPKVCLDRKKNPWGGATCCFHRLCIDTLRDSRSCGACGKACGFGFVCCEGECVDIQNDPKHCGSCFEECIGQGRCSFAMCDYGG